MFLAGWFTFKCARDLINVKKLRTHNEITSTPKNLIARILNQYMVRKLNFLTIDWQ
jgi:hypothetical protein